MKQPTAPSLYPELPVEDGQNYRLQKVSEIQKQLITERDTRKTIYKKYKRGINVTNSINTALLSSCVVMASVGFVVPIVLPLEIAAIVSGSLGFIAGLVRDKLYSKALKHYEIKTLADSKINSIRNLVSQALTDGQISEHDFKMVLDELDKYNELKEKTHSKKSGLSDAEQKKLIARGRAEALNAIKKNVTNA